jgi:preprotein translocase subunit SecE
MKEKEIQKANAKNAKPKNKKPNFFVRMGRKIKEVFSELKKVSWPSFSKVVKQTGIVLGVVALFMVVITLIDFGLGQLLTLLTSIGG